jgi:hypothetical protein
MSDSLCSLYSKYPHQFWLVTFAVLIIGSDPFYKSYLYDKSLGWIETL